MQGLRGATSVSMMSFWVQCHNPECRHEHQFTEDISYVSQFNWICPRCNTNLFGNIDLFTLTDNTIVDIAENLFSPSPARTEAPPPSDNDLMALAAPLFTPSPVKKKVASSVDKENVSLQSEPRLREATEGDKKPSPSRSVISVSSSDSPFRSVREVTIKGLQESRGVGEAVFYITFARKNSFKGFLAVGLVVGAVKESLRISRLVVESEEEASLDGEFTLRVGEGGSAAFKQVLNLRDMSLVSPSFPVERVGRGMGGVKYRLSSRMLEWFQQYGGQYRPMRSKSEGFEGVYRRWQKACAVEGGKVEIAPLINVLHFFHSYPFQRFGGKR